MAKIDYVIRAWNEKVFCSSTYMFFCVLSYPNSQVGLTNEYFVSAIEVTCVALVGLQKQSVEDAERLVSPQVAQFMEVHADDITATHFQMLSDLHEANDSRGKSEEWRRFANQSVLKYIVEDYMPWPCDGGICDVSLIDINS